MPLTPTSDDTTRAAGIFLAKAATDPRAHEEGLKPVDRLKVSLDIATHIAIDAIAENICLKAQLKELACSKS